MTAPAAPDAVDHRRAIAQRNVTAVLDATERLLASDAPLSMTAVAAQAGVSRPTLYAHFKTIGDLVEAAVQRAVTDSVTALGAAQPLVGPAQEALLRMAESSWNQLARYQGVARRAAEYLPRGALHRTYAPLMADLRALIERGQAEGAFRSDLPGDWLVTTFFALVHAADDHAGRDGTDRAAAFPLLHTTLADVFFAR